MGASRASGPVAPFGGNYVYDRPPSFPVRKNWVMLPTRVIKLLIPFALVLSFFVAACGTTSTSTNFSGTVVIWHNWQGDYLKAKQDIFHAYETAHPNVKIQLVHQDNVVDKSITAI